MHEGPGGVLTNLEYATLLSATTWTDVAWPSITETSPKIRRPQKGQGRGLQIEVNEQTTGKKRIHESVWISRGEEYLCRFS
jgi:hypothetical protein